MSQRAARRERVVVIGAGVVGLLSAYYLARAGHVVRVLESAGEDAKGASYGNLGMVVPSHALPLAAPGVLWQGLRWMSDPESPFYLKPRLSWPTAKWAYRFWRASSRQRAERAAVQLLALHLASVNEYRELAGELGDFGFQQRGLLMLSETAEGHAFELASAAKANAWGLDIAGLTATALSPRDLHELEPDAGFAVNGAVLYPSDAHLDPRALLARLREVLAGLGVEIVDGAPATLAAAGDAVTVTAKGETTKPANVVLAAGAWSGRLAGQAGLRLPLEPGKGYSLTLTPPPFGLNTPSILTEARVAITPLPDALRIGGTLELAGFDDDVGARRLKGITTASRRALPSLSSEALSAAPSWHGFRPLSPDGLPYLGRSRRLKNLVVATGHAMMGVSLAPISGRIVADLVAGRPEGSAARLLASGLFDPERYSR